MGVEVEVEVEGDGVVCDHKRLVGRVGGKVDGVNKPEETAIGRAKDARRRSGRGPCLVGAGYRPIRRPC